MTSLAIVSCSFLTLAIPRQFYVVTPEASEWDAPQEVLLLMLTIDWLPAYLAKLDFWSYFTWRLINEVRHEHFHSGCGFEQSRTC